MAASQWTAGMPAAPGAPKQQMFAQPKMNYAANYAAGAGAAAAAMPLAQTNQRNTNATAAGMDFMKPGASEQFNSQYGAGVMAPGSSEQFWSNYGGQMMQPGMQQGYAQQQINQGSRVPSANIDPYYDRAEQNVTTKLSAQQAARGAYGSSVGVGQVGSALADLEAQRAKDTADYGLKQSAEARGWMTDLGGLAQGADANALNRWTAGGSAAATADQANLARWKAAAGEADTAQSAQRTRGQDFFNNNITIGDRNSGLAGTAYAANQTQDQGLLDAIIALGIGKDAEGVAAATQKASQDEAYRKQIMDAYSAYQAKNTASKPPAKA